jgi:hypothetical protein
MPYSHLVEPYSRQYIHKEHSFSSAQISHSLGRERSSKKKIPVEISKKSVKKGVKIRFPKTVVKEKGNPQAAKIGSDIRERKSWTCIKL